MSCLMTSHISCTLAGATMRGVEGPGKCKTIIILGVVQCGGKEGDTNHVLGMQSGEGRILANCEVAGCDDILKH